MTGLTSEEKLSRSGLSSLEFRRVRGDFIATSKILTGFRQGRFRKNVSDGRESRTRGHILRLKGKPFRTEVRGNFFIKRVVNVWIHYHRM